MCWLWGGLPWEVGEQKPERALYSHGKKRPTEFNLLIKFRTSGHEGLDCARHSGVSSVSHERLSHTPDHAHCGWIEWLSRKTEQQDSDPLKYVDLCLLCQQLTSAKEQLQPWSLVKCKCSLFIQWAISSKASNKTYKCTKIQSKAFTCLTANVLGGELNHIPYMASCSPPSTTSTCPVT